MSAGAFYRASVRRARELPPAWLGRPKALPMGMVACKCGSRSQGEAQGGVPAWFGRDCIEADCPLKAMAA